MKSFLINILIAATWLLLSKSPSSFQFFLGFTVGFLLMSLFPSIMESQSYTRRSLAFIRFALMFFREFIRANIKVAAVVLFKSKESISPNFLSYNVNGMNPVEILLLFYCISLTPGSLTVKISDDFQTMILHSLDADDPEAIRKEIDRTMKVPILSFMR